MANAPNVLQPYWLIVLPLDVPALAASLLLWGPSGQRWWCSWIFLFSIVPTFATIRLREILATKCGTTWARIDRCILLENAWLPRNIQGSFTCRKSTTWDRRLYLPSEGRRAEDFFSPWKIQLLRSALNPRTWVPKASTLPLDHRSRYCHMWKMVQSMALVVFVIYLPETWCSRQFWRVVTVLHYTWDYPVAHRVF